MTVLTIYGPGTRVRTTTAIDDERSIFWAYPSGEQCRAARVDLRWSEDDFIGRLQRAGYPMTTIELQNIEAFDAPPLHARALFAMQTVFHAAGIRFVGNQVSYESTVPSQATGVRAS